MSVEVSRHKISFTQLYFHLNCNYNYFLMLLLQWWQAPLNRLTCEFGKFLFHVQAKTCVLSSVFIPSEFRKY